MRSRFWKKRPQILFFNQNKLADYHAAPKLWTSNEAFKARNDEKHTSTGSSHDADLLMGKYINVNAPKHQV